MVKRLLSMSGIGLCLLLSGVVLPVTATRRPPDPARVLEWIDARAAWKQAFAESFDAAESRDVRNYDVQHYTLHLIPDFDTNTMAGEVEIQALSNMDGLQLIALDMGSRIDVDMLSCGGVAVNYLHEDGILEIVLDRPYNAGELITIFVSYSGNPPSWTFNFAEHNGTPVFATMAEPEGARQWWPCNDVPWDKATVTLRATVPDWMFVAANGLMTADIDNGDTTHTVTWDTQYLTSTYLVAAAGTNYETIMFEYTPAGTDTPMPVPVYVYPELRSNAETAFEDTVDMIDFFSRNFGEYPFLDEKYGQVLVPIGGGMEHQTITHINAQYIEHGGQPSSLIAHELAHQWWGDYITMSDWPHIWLNESFATYSDALYHEYAFGFEYLKSLMQSYRNRQYEGSIYDPVYLFDSIVYTKGAFVLHMLRRTVGDDVFWDILQTYYRDQRFAYANASSDQFQEICETLAGEDLDWFFQQWIYGTQRPTIQYGWDYEPLPGGGFQTTVQLEQIQQDLPLFKLLLDIQLNTDSGSVIESAWIENASHTIQQVTDAPPTHIVLDPDVWALAYFQPAPDQFQFTNEDRLPQAHFGEQYSVALQLTGGEPPYSMEIIEGAPPMGIRLDTETGRLTGFPLEKGRTTFTVRATDSRSYPRYTRQTFTLKALYPQAELTVVPDKTEYLAGETMTVNLDLTGPDESPVAVWMYILLEAEGAFYFLDFTQDVFPAFTEDSAALAMTIPPGFDLNTDLLVLPLPDPLPALNGAWWSLMMNADTATAAGPLSTAPFTFTGN